ncbi:MAG TPA: hypothetical protein VGH23_01565 [Rhizomicrobium sp.]
MKDRDVEGKASALHIDCTKPTTIRKWRRKGCPMGEYEFRILKGDGTLAYVTSEFHIADNPAIHAARKAADGKAFEVWLGSERIYPAPIGKD